MNKSLNTTALCAILLLPQLRAEDAPYTFAEHYRPAAAKLIGAALEDDHGLRRLEYLCDRIGSRLSGSPALDKAIAWAAGEMKKAGLENVRTQPVTVPKWVRGHESAVLLSPLERPIAMLGLGGSVGTPAQGVTGDVVAVSSFTELEALGREKVASKIVLYNEPFTGYGHTVVYRGSGASRAAKLGAIAALVRSVTPLSLRSPHTGALRYDPAITKIPSAAVSVEDAESLARLYRSGAPVRVRLMMEAHQDADAPSANVMGEIPGTDLANEIVVLGGHIDSWDVGQGAQDDGSGIIAALEAVALIKQLGLHPRRTIRVVFYTNEENGLAGGTAYRAALGDKIRTHVAAIEMDEGAEKPVGFDVSVKSEKGIARAFEIGKLLDAIEAGGIQPGEGGADISPLTADGVPGFGLRTVGIHYFDWHHTQADTFDKINPHEFRLNTAALAVLSYVLADMSDRIGDL